MSLSTPLRWPASWTQPSALDLLRGTPVNLILFPDSPQYDAVRARAREVGIATTPPADVVIVAGVWPGVKPSRAGDTAAGPTGAAWVDSNGWAVRLARAQHPGRTIWVDAPPKDRSVYSPSSYALAIADAAAHGGQWVFSLDPELAAAVTPDSPAWSRILSASAWFSAKSNWTAYTPAAVVGVLSDFAGPNEFMGQELLNLLARAGQQYRILTDKQNPDLTGLRAILYADPTAPSPALRQQAMTFVESGGLLIAPPAWGKFPKTIDDTHPRYALYSHGKGRLAIAREDPSDPWLLANDSVVLVSHRHDLVRCFNSGAFGAYCTQSPGRATTLVHLFFYADRGPSEASVRIAGNYRSARLFTLDDLAPKPVPCQFTKDAAEVHLPQVPQYVALEVTA